MNKKTIILQLNELNFEEILKFSKKYNLKNIEKFFTNFRICQTEEKYELLEPWIQWTSFYTGMSYEKHNVFKIGDTKNTNLKFFPSILSKNINVGSFFSMNLPELHKGTFFPDPWIEINKQNMNRIQSFVHKNLSFFVNNNTSKILGIFNYLKLIFIILFFFKVTKIPLYLKLIYFSLKKRFFRAIFFDFLSFEIFKHYLNKKKEFDLSLIFLNGGAHIQHHHLLKFSFNNQGTYPNDPFSIYLKYLDLFLKDLNDFQGYNLLFISGLSQEIIKEPIFYYRLNNHSEFFKKINLNFNRVQKLMSRDFFIHFNNLIEMNKGKEILAKMRVSDNQLLFGDFKSYEDNKLFVSCTYKNALENKFIIIDEKKYFLKEFLNFVATKNSIHSKNCYYNYFGEFSNHITNQKIKNITDFYDIFLNFYD